VVSGLAPKTQRGTKEERMAVQEKMKNSTGFYETRSKFNF
jgi:hypothetical protein